MSCSYSDQRPAVDELGPHLLFEERALQVLY
jgi:hypothetical protein